MKKFCRLFLKGDPTRWLDFELPSESTGILNFIAQMRFEGFAASPNAYITCDEVRVAIFIQTAEPTLDFTKARMQ